MRNLKKILALVVVFALAISMMANAVSFTDLTANKTGDDNKIGFVTQLGVVKGYPSADGKTFEFRADRNISRAEVATIIYRLLTGDVANANFKAKTNFPDATENDWFSGYVKYATALEPSVILGRTNGKFDPHAEVTVAEAATMLVRALGYEKMVSLESGVAKACELGILDTAAGADAAATRGQVVDMVYNAMFNKYLRTATTGALGQTVADTLVYSVFKITPFDAVLTGSASDVVNLAVIEYYDGFLFSDNYFDWILNGGYDSFMGKPKYTNISGKYAGMDKYVGYSVRVFAKDTNGNKKLDVYDTFSFIYVSPKNVVKEGTMKDFGSQSNSNERVANGKFAFVKGESNEYKYETAPAEGEPIRVFENGRLMAESWTSFDAGFAAYANPGMTVEAYFEQFMGSFAYAEYKMIDYDGDGSYEYAWTTYTGSAILGDTTSTGYVYFGNIDNTIEKRTDWDRISPKFTDYFDNTISIKASDVTFGNAAVGDYVHITPKWDGGKYTYTLEKAETVTGKVTAVAFGGQSTIQLDGKSYTMANTHYLYNYPGYIRDFKVDEGPYGLSFYGLDEKTNLGKYFKLVINKAGYVWRVDRYTPTVGLTQGQYGIITEVASAPVNLKADDVFATPEWCIPIKMMNEKGETNVYVTNITVDWTAGQTPAIANIPAYQKLVAAKGTKFLRYEGDSKGRLVVEDIASTTTKVEDIANGYDNNWTNIMTALNTVFDYSAATKYFVKDGFNSANGDLKYKVDDNTTIFSFTDKNGNNKKDADEPATVIKASELKDLNNAVVYADDTFAYSTGIKYVYAIVLMNKSTTAVTTHIGWWQATQAKSYDSEGKEAAWTYKFAEHNGDKTYSSTVAFPNPWAFAGSSYRLFMYDVDEDGNIVKFYNFANGDFTRTPAAFAEGVYFTVQLGNSDFVDANTMDLDLFIDVKNPVVPGDTMTIASNALLTDDTKVYILKTADNKLTDDSWYKANSSAADPFFDFNKWTGNYAGTVYDLSGTDASVYNQNGDYYQFGWAKFAVENGQLTIVELYLTEEPLGL